MRFSPLVPLGLVCVCFSSLFATPADRNPSEPVTRDSTAVAETTGVSRTLPRRTTHEEAIGLYYAGAFDEAVRAFALLHAASDNNAAIRADFARLLREAGRHSDAMRVLGAGAAATASAEIARLAAIGGNYSVALGLLNAASTDPEILFWRGYAAASVGDYHAAVAALSRSIELAGDNPRAHIALAEIDAASGNHDSAVRRYLRALSLDQNLTAAFLPLARSYIELGRLTDAHALLMRAEIALPWNREVRELRAMLAEAAPEIEAARTEQLRVARTVARPPRVTTLAADRDEIPTIRVGLAENLVETYAKTGARYRITRADGETVAEGEPDAILRITASNDALEIVVDDEVVIAVTEPLRITYDDPTATTIVFDFAHSAGQFAAGREDRAYRGEIEILPRRTGFTLVNIVNVEEYLYSVVPSEIPASWPTAALEAQAIAARAYTLANRGRFAARGFDLSGSVASAFYRGVRGEAARTTAAVIATRGEIVSVAGRPLSAFYSANHAGYTETTSSVWGFDSPHVAVADKLIAPRDGYIGPSQLAHWIDSRIETYSGAPRFVSPSAYRWVTWVPRAEIEGRAGSAGVGTITRIVTIGRGISGRVEAVRVTGTDGETIVRGDTIRSRMGGIRSNLFTVEPVLGADGIPEFFIFTGAGWGHGVGMCQTGAAGMAAAGYEARAILAHYYPAADITSYY